MKKQIIMFAMATLLICGCSPNTQIQNSSAPVPIEMDAPEDMLPTDVYDELFLSGTYSLENDKLTRFLDDIFTSLHNVQAPNSMRMDMDICFSGPTRTEYKDNLVRYATYDFYCYDRTELRDRTCAKGNITIELTNSKWVLDSWEVSRTEYLSPYIYIDFSQLFLQPGQFIEDEDILSVIPDTSKRWQQITSDYYRENAPVIHNKDGVTSIEIGEVEYSAYKSDLPDYKWVLQDMTLSANAIEKWFYYHLKEDYKLKSAMGKDRVKAVLGQPLIEGNDYLLYQVCYPATFLMLNEKVGVQTAWSSGRTSSLLQENYLYCFFDKNGLSSIKFTISRDHRIVKGTSPTSDIFVYVLSKEPFYTMQWKRANYYNENKNAESIVSPVGRMLIGRGFNERDHLLWDSYNIDGALAQDYAYNGLKCGKYSEYDNVDLLLKTSDSNCATFYMYFDNIYNVKTTERLTPVFYDFTKPIVPEALNDALRHWDIP